MEQEAPDTSHLGAVPSVTKAPATSVNKQVAPTPRCARLRGTPAQGVAEPGGGAEIIEQYGFVDPCGRAGVATLERYVTSLVDTQDAY
jgi:hypothetical protein